VGRIVHNSLNCRRVFAQIESGITLSIESGSTNTPHAESI
jgi:hypothetical protein